MLTIEFLLFLSEFGSLLPQHETPVITHSFIHCSCIHSFTTNIYWVPPASGGQVSASCGKQIELKIGVQEPQNTSREPPGTMVGIKGDGNQHGLGVEPGVPLRKNPWQRNPKDAAWKAIRGWLQAWWKDDSAFGTRLVNAGESGRWGLKMDWIREWSFEWFLDSELQYQEWKKGMLAGMEHIVQEAVLSHGEGGRGWGHSSSGIEKDWMLHWSLLRLFQKTGLDASMELFKYGLSYRSNSTRQNQMVAASVVILCEE